jgi:hypothetical protein
VVVAVPAHIRTTIHKLNKARSNKRCKHLHRGQHTQGERGEQGGGISVSCVDARVAFMQACSVTTAAQLPLMLSLSLLLLQLCPAGSFTPPPPHTHHTHQLPMHKELAKAGHVPHLFEQWFKVLCDAQVNVSMLCHCCCCCCHCRRHCCGCSAEALSKCCSPTTTTAPPPLPPSPSSPV